MDKVKSAYDQSLPVIDNLSPIELSTIAETIDYYSKYDEKELCRLSYRDNPSQIAEDYQALEYEAAYYRRPFYSMRHDEDERVS